MSKTAQEAAHKLRVVLQRIWALPSVMDYGTIERCEAQLTEAILAAEQRGHVAGKREGRAEAFRDAATVVIPHCLCDAVKMKSGGYAHRDLCPVSINAYLLFNADMEAKRDE